MIREFQQTFRIKLPAQVLELVAFRIQTGSRPRHRCVGGRLLLQDRWLIQTIFRHRGQQQGLGIAEEAVMFEGNCPWQEAYPQMVQIDYLRRPYCLDQHLTWPKPDQSELCLILKVPVDFDLEENLPFQPANFSQNRALALSEDLDLQALAVRLGRIENQLGISRDVFFKAL